MSDQNRCPQCGAALAANAPQGLCPACLLNQGLTTPTEPVGEPSAAAPPECQPPTPADLAPHFPDLEILAFVGRGGMGMVYQARQKRLDRLVALKILLPHIAQDPAFAQRFQREARALALLNHPHIVAVHDFGQADGLYYFLMEFVDGVNLRQLLNAGQLTPREALGLVPQICEALQFAHDNGVVHRDIKPENILLDKRGQVKIADFGLAKLVGREPQGLTLTGTGQVMGTPHYMAPEQMERPEHVDHRADIYSLGVVFYQMLTGELPLGRFAPPSRKVRLDVRLDEVVLRALEKDPALRYQHASDVKTELETIVTSPAPAAGPSRSAATTGEVAADPVRRQIRGPATGLLVAGILDWVLIPIAVLVLLFVFPNPLQGSSAVPAAMFVAALFALLLPSLVIFGALKMMRLEAYVLAVAASLLAIVVSPGNLIGLPLGIWALAVLSQADVREAFRRTAEQAPRRREPDAETARLSRTATAGAVWAPFFFLVVLLSMMVTVVAADPGQPPPGPAWWQMVLSATVLPLGLTAPFGTTILGCVAVAQIRRARGRLYGLPLAVADALLFPLLLLDVVLGWCWWLVIDGIHDALVAAAGPLSPVAAAFVQNEVELTVLATLVTAAVLDFLIVLAAWRAATRPLDY